MFLAALSPREVPVEHVVHIEVGPSAALGDRQRSL